MNKEELDFWLFERKINEKCNNYVIHSLTNNEQARIKKELENSSSILSDSKDNHLYDNILIDCQDTTLKEAFSKLNSIYDLDFTFQTDYSSVLSFILSCMNKNVHLQLHFFNYGLLSLKEQLYVKTLLLFEQENCLNLIYLLDYRELGDFSTYNIKRLDSRDNFNFIKFVDYENYDRYEEELKYERKLTRNI